MRRNCLSVLNMRSTPLPSLEARKSQAMGALRFALGGMTGRILDDARGNAAGGWLSVLVSTIAERLKLSRLLRHGILAGAGFSIALAVLMAVPRWGSRIHSDGLTTEQKSTMDLGRARCLFRQVHGNEECQLRHSSRALAVTDLSRAEIGDCRPHCQSSAHTWCVRYGWEHQLFKSLARVCGLSHASRLDDPLGSDLLTQSAARYSRRLCLGRALDQIAANEEPPALHCGCARPCWYWRW